MASLSGKIRTQPKWRTTMRMTRDLFDRWIAALAVVALLGAVPSVASAAGGSRKFHPSSCQVKSGTATFIDDVSAIGNFGTVPLVLYCPLLHDSSPPVNYFPNARFVGWSVGCTD